MGIFKKLFGKKKNLGEEILDTMDDLGMEISLESEVDLTDTDYQHNHCFVFFGLNQEGFEAIEKEVQNFDGPDHLSLLRSQAGVFMTDLVVSAAGSEKVKEHLKADEVEVDEKHPEWKPYEQYEADAEKLKAYVEKRFDLYEQNYKEQLITDENREIGTDFLEFLKKERTYLIENITYGMKKWAESDYFEKEDFIGAMIVFVKSSKEFDKDDSISENQDGMNLVVTTRNGFVRDCVYALEDITNVKYENNEEPENVAQAYAESREIWEREEDNINRYCPNIQGNTIFGAFTKDAPVGITYFDQEGRLWNIKEVFKAVTLVREGIDEYERTVSH